MADLSTIDITKPQDSDAVSAGASRMREERAAIVGSFSSEHSITGPHAFLLGNEAALPAAGTRGRIFLDTTQGKILLDDGANWNFLRTTQPQLFTNSASIGMGVGFFANLLTGTLHLSQDLFLGTFILAIASTQISKTAVTTDNYNFRIVINGAEAIPTGQLFPTPASNATFTYNVIGVSAWVSGTADVTITFDGKPNAVSGLHHYTSLLVFQL